MRAVRIAGVTLHCSTADSAKLARAKKLLEFITKRKAVITIAKKRIPTWKVRPGMDIGCKVTLRGKEAEDILARIFVGVPLFKEKQFNAGFMNFGIKEYIEIPSIEYQREIGIMGFEVVVVLKRPGFSVSARRHSPGKIGPRHKISKEETIEFFKKNFNLNIEK